MLAILALALAAIPADWAEKVAKGDMLYAAQEPSLEFMPAGISSLAHLTLQWATASWQQ